MVYIVDNVLYYGRNWKEVWFTICEENEIFQDFLNTSESSNDNTNVVNAPQEPFVFNQDPGENSSQSPLHIDHHCCYGCGDSLNGIFCHQCTCESCGNGAHIGYNCPPKVPIISNPKPCHNQNELDEYINTPSWNRPTFYNYDDDDEEYTIAITPVLSTEEPVDSLIMEDEHLDTIPATKLDEVIKSSVEDLVPILSKSEGIPDNMCDVPFRDNSPPLDISKDQFEDFSDSNDDSTSIDDDYFSIDDINDVEASPPDYKLFSLEEVKDDILREKLLNIHLLIAKIKSLNDNPTPDRVLKSPSSFPIPVEDSDSFFEKSDTSLSYSDNSLPEFETFSDNMEETSSGSTTTHADNSLPDYDSFLFEIEPDQGELTSVVMKDILGEPRVHVPKVLPTHPTLYLDSNFIPFDNSLPESESFYFDFEEKNSGSTTIYADISLSVFDHFHFKIEHDPSELASIVDFGICENVLSVTNVNLSPEDDQSPLFAYVVWIFLPFLTYPVAPPYLLSSGNEETNFDPSIFIYHSFMPGVSYRTCSESRPPMLNKENYVPWSSRLLRYAKSRPNGKQIQNSILNYDELSDKELKQIEADDQAIQTILLSLPEDIYAAVDSCETAQEIWLRVQQMMKGSDIGNQEKKAKLFKKWERFTSNEEESIESYYHRFLKLMNDLKRNKHFPEKIASNLKFLNNLQPEWSRHVTIVHQTKDLHTTNYTQLYDFLKYNQKEVDELKAKQIAKTQDPLALMKNSNNPFAFPASHQDQPSFNQNYLQQPMPNPEDITDPTTSMNMALTLMAKAFKLNYSTPTNNNKRISSNPRNRQIAQPGMNMGQDRQMQMVGGNGGNQFRQYAGQNVGNPAGFNDIKNGNLVAARAEGNAAGQNGNQIRCYNCRGVGHYARNCTVMPKRRDAAYLQTQLLIAQKEEEGI
nr:hypothetical protein [Tanacetum cinerariifolium]